MGGDRQDWICHLLVPKHQREKIKALDNDSNEGDGCELNTLHMESLHPFGVLSLVWVRYHKEFTSGLQA
jgi:hypothetical protein